MNQVLFAFIVMLLAFGATYFFCVRPMRKGKCVMGGTGTASKDAEGEAGRLKSEIAALRAQSSRPGPE